MNQVVLTGRLTKDAEVYEGASGAVVARFTLAVDKLVNGVKSADFIPCVAFAGTAEIIDAYCAKGHKIGVTGKIETNTWEDDEGSKHFQTNVIVNSVEFLESKKDATEETTKTSTQPTTNKIYKTRKYTNK